MAGKEKEVGDLKQQMNSNATEVVGLSAQIQNMFHDASFLHKKVNLFVLTIRDVEENK